MAHCGAYCDNYRGGHTGTGFEQSRMVCNNKILLGPFYDRDFVEDTTRPEVFCGGREGLSLQTDVESKLRGVFLREPGGANRIDDLLHWGPVIPQLIQWEQPDFRPWYYQDFSRQMVHDANMRYLSPAAMANARGQQCFADFVVGRMRAPTALESSLVGNQVMFDV